MRMLSGLYKADYITPERRGFGVVTFHEGAVRGGDSIVAYNGTYCLSGQEVTMELEAFRHSHKADLDPIFGKDHVRISLRGNLLADGRVLAQAASLDAPHLPMKVVLTKLRD